MVNALENFRRFIVGSPPWTIFMLSLGIMAVGVLVLACRLKIDPDYQKDHGLSNVYLCYDPSSTSKQASDMAAVLPAYNVSIPVTIRIENSFAEMLNSSEDVTFGLGQFYSGQMGLKGLAGNNHNWTMLLPMALSACHDKGCKENVIHSCLLLFANDLSVLPAIEMEDSCATNWSREIRQSKNFRVATLKNKADGRESQSQAAFSPVPPGSSEFCAHGSSLRMHIDERAHFVLIPLVHDTLAARLHLLYTSYFLFMTLLVLFCYAMCKGHSFHKSRYLIADASMEDIVMVKKAPS